jgi:cyclopropane-fatty-acyl-phospholipid synthase
MFDASNFLAVTGFSLLVVVLLMVATAVEGHRQGRVSVVDTTWGLGFVVVAAVAGVVGDGAGWRRLALFVVVALWGLRLAWHMHQRNSGKGEDPRYAEMLSQETGNPTLLAIRKVYAVQGLAVWFVSLEMGEHVGQGNYPTYAKVLHDRVRPGGRVLVQQMSRQGRHPGGGPFIESFIAPDMHMRPVGETVDLIEGSGLEVRDVHAMREHYVRTVAAWYRTFEDNIDQVVALVGDEVARVWRLYLVGGAMAFRDGRMGVDQILAVRPDHGESDLEPVRPTSWS